MKLSGPAVVLGCLIAAAAAAGEWHGQVGALALQGPDYLGSDERRSRLLPLVQLRYGEHLYLGHARFGQGAGVGWASARRGGWQWGTELLATPDRDADEAAALAGMDDRDVGAVAATGLAYRHGLYSASLGLAAGLTDDAGLTALVSIGIASRLGRRASGALSLTAVLADADSMAYDFGIGPDEARRRAALVTTGDRRLRPGEAGPYDPDGGLKEIRLGLRLGYALTQAWQVGGFVGWSQLQGDAADSPLARDDSAVAGGLSLGYRF